MVRTQIQLEDQQAQTLKALAHERGCSMAELIRQSVDNYIASSIGPTTNEERKRRAIEAAGLFHSGKPDLGTNHDLYLDEAFQG